MKHLTAYLKKVLGLSIHATSAAEGRGDGPEAVQYPGPAAVSSLAEEIRSKMTLLPTTFPGHYPVDNARFVVFDTETTGIHPYAGDEVISLGAVVVHGGRVKDHIRFHRLVNPGRPIPGTVQVLTGITDDHVRHQPTLVEVLPSFLDFAAGGILAAHCAAFDLAFLNLKLRRYCHTRLRATVIDTVSLSSALHPTLPGYTLDELAARYNLSTAGRHTALGDALITAHLLVALLAEARASGVATMRGLLNHLHTFRLGRPLYM